MLLSNLSKEMTELLNEFLDVRNWSFHNPQSMMVAAKETSEKNIPDELKGNVKIIPQINPVIIPKVSRYEFLVLVSLVLHTENRIEQFKTVLESMKRDYQEMYDTMDDKSLVWTINGFSSDVQYVETYRTSRLTDYNSDIKQISMAIQKSKYDGSEEKYKEFIFRFNKNKTEENE